MKELSSDAQWCYAGYVAMQPRGDVRWQEIIDHMFCEIASYLAFLEIAREDS
jgi:hypothetical protein